MQPSEAQTRPLPGQVFDGKFLIVEELGEGGMGVVFAAHNGTTSSGFPVAIKWLKPEAVKDRLSVRQFLREADLAGYIKSEFVVKVFDKHESPTYLVMERLVGRSLRQYLDAQGGPLGPAEVVKIMGPVMRAVRAAHRTELPDGVGVLHRDLKPENIFLDESSGEAGFTPKVLDFGIAKLLEPSAEITMDTTDLVRGTPSYMAREQLFERGGVGPWTDVHALGVILYEMLAGQRPFGGTVAFDVCLNVREGVYQPLKELRPDLPDGLCEVIERAFHHDRSQRYQSVADLEVALHPYWGAMPGSSVDLPPNPELSGPGATSSSVRSVDTGPPGGKGPAMPSGRFSLAQHPGMALRWAAVLSGSLMLVGSSIWYAATLGDAEPAVAVEPEAAAPAAATAAQAPQPSSTPPSPPDLPTDLVPSDPLDELDLPQAPAELPRLPPAELREVPRPPAALASALRKSHPRAARVKGDDGLASVSVVLDSDGDVLEVVRGHESDHEYEWFEACRHALMDTGGWSPAPRTADGLPAEAEVPYMCRFRAFKGHRSSAENDAEKARRALARAQALYDQGSLELARRQYCTVLRHDPKNARAALKLKLMNARCP